MTMINKISRYLALIVCIMTVCLCECSNTEIDPFLRETIDETAGHIMHLQTVAEDVCPHIETAQHALGLFGQLLDQVIKKSPNFLEECGITPEGITEESQNSAFKEHVLATAMSLNIDCSECQQTDVDSVVVSNILYSINKLNTSLEEVDHPEWIGKCADTNTKGLEAYSKMEDEPEKEAKEKLAASLVEELYLGAIQQASNLAQAYIVASEQGIPVIVSGQTGNAVPTSTVLGFAQDHLKSIINKKFKTELENKPVRDFWASFE